MSHYPTLSEDNATQIMKNFLENGHDVNLITPNIEMASYENSSEENEFNEKLLDQLIKKMIGNVKQNRAKGWDDDKVESYFSAYLFEALTECNTPIQALSNHNFWRYLSLAKFWWFIEIRQPDPNSRGRYIHPKSPSKHVLVRCYNRGRLSASNEEKAPFKLSELAKQDTEMWQSQILGVNTSFSQEMTKAIVTKQAEHRLGPGPGGALRQIGKKINRFRANIYLYNFSEKNSEDLINELWDDE